MASLPPTDPRRLYVGLMSGTSLDGTDAVLFDARTRAVLGHVHAPFPAALRDELLALNTPGGNELHRAALAANGTSAALTMTRNWRMSMTGLLL